MRLAIALCALLFTACGTPLAGGFLGDPLRVLTGLDATHTFEVRLAGDESASGYLLEFYAGEAGTKDERKWPAGTVLIQDLDFQNVGFIDYLGKAYRFDKSGKSHDISAVGRHAQVAKLLGLTGKLIIRSALPGIEPPTER